MQYRIVKESPPPADTSGNRFAVYQGQICYERFSSFEEAEEAINRFKAEDTIGGVIEDFVAELARQYGLSDDQVRRAIRENL